MRERDYTIDAGHLRLHYRPDIDGLRAVAVLPVVFYHLGIALFGGGYVGVDVFFVISGFLITGAIAKEIEQGRFSILSFYERRARRILPALFAMIAAVTITGVVLFMPDELRDTGASIAGVAAFASNILFWKQTDYFNAAVELKPLIHTWSLAVEEQFYIFFPLVLMLIARFARGCYRWPILSLAAGSLALSIALLRYDASANYYLLPSRAWELLTGSALALDLVPPIRNRVACEFFSAAGLFAILGGALLLTAQSAFPGYNALWPCLGAAALIHANATAPTAVGRLLGRKPLVAIGLISYSLYLVHWPIIVFVDYALIRSPSAIEMTAMFATMLVLATLSWRFVERPFRSRQRFSRGAILSGSAAMLMVFGALGVALFKLDGLPQRFPHLRAAEVRNEDKTPQHGPVCFLKGDWHRWAGDACFLTHASGPVTLLWGDSHANHYRRAIAGAKPPIAASILFYASAGCLPILGTDKATRSTCPGNNAHVLDIIRAHHVSTVIMAGYWERFMTSLGLSFGDLAHTIAMLRAAGVTVKLIGDNPDYSFANPQFLAYRLEKRSDPSAAFYMPSRTHPEFNERLRALVGRSDFFDPSAVLCRADRQCLVYEHGDILMTDNSHLSAYGGRKVMTAMRQFLEAH